MTGLWMADCETGMTERGCLNRISSGTYYLGVASFDPSLVGHYTINLKSAADPAAQFFATQTLQIGAPLVGEVDLQRNDGFVRFAAEGGTRYRFTLLSTYRYARIALLDLDGHTIVPVELRAQSLRDADSDYSYSVTFTWTAASSGTYYISIDGNRYSMSAEVLDEDSPPSEPQLADEWIGGVAAIIEEGNAGFFAFHAIAGRSYRFRTVLGTMEDSVLGRFDPITQTMIAVNDDTEDEAMWDDEVQSLSSQIEWTADRTGDVYLLVYSYDSGSYRLEIYSTSAAMKEETLAAISLPKVKSNELVRVAANALYADEEDWTLDGFGCVG